MPAVDTVLLPLCVGLSLLGLILTGVAWRRGRRGRVVQAAGLALAPIALYLTGLLGLLWNAVVAVGSWAARIVFSPAVWVGLSLLGVCVVLWVVGGTIARRAPAPTSKKAITTSAAAPSKVAAVAGAPAQAKRQPRPSAVEDDPELAEIEALLKKRGIE